MHVLFVQWNKCFVCSEIFFVLSSFLTWVIVLKLLDIFKKQGNDPAENEQMLKQLARHVSWRTFVEEMLSKGEVLYLRDYVNSFYRFICLG